MVWLHLTPPDASVFWSQIIIIGKNPKQTLFKVVLEIWRKSRLDVDYTRSISAVVLSCCLVLPCESFQMVALTVSRSFLCTISKGTRISLLIHFLLLHVAWLSIFSEEETISQVQRTWRIIPHLIRWSSSVTSNFVPLLGALNKMGVHFPLKGIHVRHREKALLRGVCFYHTLKSMMFVYLVEWRLISLDNLASQLLVQGEIW